jgi:vacuolar-type H+-ATPase subunit E/Vma4
MRKFLIIIGLVLFNLTSTVQAYNIAERRQVEAQYDDYVMIQKQLVKIIASLENSKDGTVYMNKMTADLVNSEGYLKALMQQKVIALTTLMKSMETP